MEDEKQTKSLLMQLAGDCLMLGIMATASFWALLLSLVFFFGAKLISSGLFCLAFSMMFAQVALWMAQAARSHFDEIENITGRR